MELTVELRWFVVQIHPWAIKKKRTHELAQEARRRLKDQSLQIFYGVNEDESKKYPSPYDEYLFIEYRDGTGVPELKDEEFFVGVLRGPGGAPQVVQGWQVAQMREDLLKLPVYRPGEWVVIQEGAHTGCQGEVLDYVVTDIEGQAQVVVRVVLGDSIEETAVPARWVKRRKKRKGI